MGESWIFITIAAAFFQNLRSALQKHLKGYLSLGAAAYCRFVYALPLALIYLLLLTSVGERTLPPSNVRFFVFCLLGAVAQILFTTTLLWMFSFKSFAVGTTFSKLEVIFVAVLGAVVLGDTLNLWASVAIGMSSLGVVLLSLGTNRLTLRGIATGLFHRQTFVGFLCAALLGACAVFFRAAALALEHDDFVTAAAWTLAVSLAIQSVLMGIYLAVREPDQVREVLRQWRWASAVGFTAAVASIGWFTAFTIQNASYVRALGQIELLFSFAATVLFFREPVKPADIAGALLVCAGILVLVLYG